MIIKECLSNFLRQQQQPTRSYSPPSRGATDAKMYGQTSYGNTVRGGRSSSSHRGARPTQSGQTIVYPSCATEHEALQCVLCVHDNDTRIPGGGGGGLSPIVHVLCVATVRDIMAGNGTRRGVFASDVRATNASRAKAYLPGLCITPRHDHHYTTYRRRGPPYGACGDLSGAISLARERRAHDPRPCVEKNNRLLRASVGI